MNINLKIEGLDVELGSAELDFALNRMYEELSNPTVICNDWSKTINIPFSVTNNAIFGSIFNVERRLARKDNYPNIGINYNASKKANFTLWYNSGLLMTGYVKLASVNNVEQVYNINLFGEVGNTFLDLLECTFNKGADVDGKYIIEDYINPNVIIDKDLVATSWRNDTPQLALEGAGTTDIVGFAPVVQGLPSDFQADTYLDRSGNFKKLADMLNSAKSINYGDSIIEDGLTEQSMRQFRTRFQKPYIYINKLWQIMVEQSKKICKYPLYLDKIWFNEKNPYYTDLIYLCTDLSENEDKDAYFKERYAQIARHTATNISYEREANAPNILLDFRLNTGVMADGTGILTINKEAYLDVKIKDGETVLHHYAVVSPEEGAYRPEGFDRRIVLFESAFSVGEYAFEFTIPTRLLNLPEKFNVEYEWKYPLYPNYNYPYTLVSNQHYGGGEWRYYEEGNTLASLSYTRALVRKDLLSLTRIWNPDVSPFEVLLNYSKMFGLIFETDHKNKRINVTCRNVYFGKYSVVDWTDKVNVIDTYSIEQPTFESKYVLFNFDEVDGKRYKTYQDKYQMSYGSKKLITEYEFNNETENLYEGAQPTNAINETYSSYKDIFTNWVVGHQIPRHTSTEVLLDNEGEDGSLNLYSAFAFRRKNQQLDSYYGDAVYITDNTIYEKNTDTYCYFDTAYYSGNAVRMTSMPFLHYIDESGLYSCLFTLPKEIYVTNTEEVEGATYVYDAFWRGYINERYDASNKKVTVDVNLTSIDYSNFKFNHLVKINNTLYVVNAIKDYGVNDGNSTEVELITVTNLNGYSDGLTFDYSYIEEQDFTFTSTAEQSKFTIHTECNVDGTIVLRAVGDTSEYVTLSKSVLSDGKDEVEVTIAPYTPSRISRARIITLELLVAGKVVDTLKITQYPKAPLPLTPIQ